MQRKLVFVEPMECKKVRRLEDLDKGRDWQLEIGFRGYRAIAIKQAGRIELYSRNGKSLGQFKNLLTALGKQVPGRFIVDGVITAFDRKGRTDIAALRKAKAKPVDAHFYIFDLLHLGRKDLKTMRLSERQKILLHAFKLGDFIHFSTGLAAPLDVLELEVRRFGFRGIVAKDRNSTYTPGKAPGTWLKKILHPV